MRNRPIKDITGVEFQHCKAMYFVEKGKRGAIWHFKCECGNEFNAYAIDVKQENVSSCGCRKIIGYQSRLRHGMSKTRLYKIWLGLKQRCLNPTNKRFNDYGGRGITVCSEWLGENGFIHFKEWALANGYREDLTIDRINNDGNYEPSNCKWVTLKEQANNKRNNYLITYRDKTMTMSQWADYLGIPYDTFRSRLLSKKWSVEKAITTPYKPIKKGVML